MFSYNDSVYTSSVLNVPGVRHAFSTRLGGVSSAPATASMNVSFGHADDDVTVRRNIDILAAKVGERAEDVVCAPQIHSDLLRFVSEENRGEGVYREAAAKGDGFYTKSPGVVLLVRTADCVPILLCGLREDGTAAVAAVHAGWRGAAQGIALLAVGALKSIGAAPERVFAAIGPCASFERYEVGEDMRDTLAALAGADVASRHVREYEGSLHADVAGINREFLLNAGVPQDHIDIAGICTISDPRRFHSHRVSGKERGTMGSVIVIERN